MTRMTVAIEGKLFADGRLIEHGAIRMEDDKVPVCWNGSFEELVGYATNLQRDDDDVTMEITVHPTYRYRVDLRECEAFVYLQPVELKSDSEEHLNYIVTSGRLRAIYLRRNL